jgi:AcrR family transcriptional regulator
LKVTNKKADTMKKNNRKKILDTAREQFLKYGYNGISIRSIAKMAGITTGAVYFHFKNKKEVYETICLEAIDVLLGIFEELDKKSKTPGKRLIATFDAYYKFYSEYRSQYNIFREYQGNYKEGDPVHTDKVIKRFERILNIMADAVQEGIDEGIFRNIDPRTTAFYLASVADGMFQFKSMGVSDSLDISADDFRRFLINITEKGILNF